MMTAKPWQLGSVVLMTAGRERGGYYVLIGTEPNGYALVADGRKRTAEQPKRKNMRHLRLIMNETDALRQAKTEQRPFRNEEIRAAITEAQDKKAKGGSDEQGRCH